MQNNRSASSSAASDSGDAVMARWLQSAGLQHLGSPTGSSDQRMLPNLLMQGYGPQSGCAPDGFYASDLRGEFGSGLLDLHSVDDTELLTEHVMSEPFELSPFIPDRGSDNDCNVISSRQQDADSNPRATGNEKEISAKESNVAKIKVVVRKRPLNKKELSRKEDDIVDVHNSANLSVHEPKLKVDLTAFVEKHEFCFDAVLDESVSNDEVYYETVQPIIPTIFQQTKATCFAYGQTGSGKTYTMQPLPLRAAADIVQLLHQPIYQNQKLKLWLSYFEIYGGKLFDLLSDRRKLCMREDGSKQVYIVGLQEFEVSDVQVVNEFIEKGNSARSTGSTGANEESSRSHAILQLVIKKQKEVKNPRRQNDGKESKGGKVIGKISFIDLAGSERGADTTDNDRQTRIEGAEINKSLLALKECIRALDNDQIHIPFRGSKLTEVLRDSFVGNSKTVMISCISPSAGSCEHTLNTLRYADRVKSLSKSGNSKKDQSTGTLLPSAKEPSAVAAYPISTELEDVGEQNQEVKPVGTPRRNTDNTSYSYTSDPDRSSAVMSSNYAFNGRKESATIFSSMDRESANINNSSSQQLNSSFKNPASVQDEEKASKVSPTRRKAPRKDGGCEGQSTRHKRQQSFDSTLNSTSRQYEQEEACSDRDINALLEEESALISAHRKEIENTMETVREEMNLLADVDQPGSQIDNYVSQLNHVLSRKAAGLASLQARLTRFQHRLKEQDILSRTKTPR